LYLGDIGHAQDKEQLTKINCKAILHVTSSYKPFFPHVRPSVLTLVVI
jgi:hypothetical protein